MIELEKLLPIVAAQVAAAGANLARCRAAERATADQITALKASRYSDIVGEGAATRVGADVKWLSWIDQRLTELAAVQANLRAEVLVAEDELRRLYGREVGLNHVIDDARKTKAALESRRSDYAS